MHNWFVGVQREIGLGIVADANYSARPDATCTTRTTSTATSAI